MMKKMFLVVVSGIVLAIGGCATMPQQEKATIMEEVPKVSKTMAQQNEGRVLKRKVAVARFTNETKYGQSFFTDKDNDRIGKQAMDILSAKLAETDKFILLERADIEKINKELAMGGNGKLDIPSDYLILGSVSEFGRKTTSDVGVFSRTKKQGAYAKVNVRLVDVNTGQVIYAEEGSGEAYAEAGTVMGIGGRAGYDSTLNDKAISAAISKMVSNIIENLLDKPWRSYVLSSDNGSYIISGGRLQGIMTGDNFTVFQKGKTVINPQTNMPIELPGKQIATLEVTATLEGDANSEVSICTLVDGSLPATDFSQFYIQVKKD